MSRFVIAVGGTGQQLALALSRLVMLGVVRSDIELVAIDSDTATPLTEALLKPGGRPPGDKHPLRLASVTAPFSVEQVGTKDFSEIFVDPNMPDQTALYQALFPSQADTIPVSKGMYGTPAVGATMFGKGAATSKIPGLLTRAAVATGGVFVLGSIVGGTGAGIVHKLVREVRKHTADKPIYAGFLLPWFNVPASATAGAITEALLQRNKEHGLTYFYEHTMPLLTAAVLAGYPTGKKTGVLAPITVEAGGMREYPHLLHLATLHGLLRLEQAQTANRTIKAYGIAHDEANEGWLLDEKWEHKGGKTLRQVLREHRILARLLGFLVEGKPRQELLAYYKGGLINTASNAAWGGSDGPFHKAIKTAQPNDKLKLGFVEGLLAEWSRRRTEIQFCVDWLLALYQHNEAMVGVPQDALLAKLTAGTADTWEELRRLWSGWTLPTKPEGYTPEIVAHELVEALRRSL